ncbi:MAG: MoaD/ThiS family protein [Candidatus Geothermarchaeota archaeon]
MQNTSTKQFIILKFKGPIRLITGDSLKLEINGELSLLELKELLINLYGKRAKDMNLYPILEDLLAQNLIIINGIEVSALDDEKTVIKGGDEVTIINFTHGG